MRSFILTAALATALGAVLVGCGGDDKPLFPDHATGTGGGATATGAGGAGTGGGAGGGVPDVPFEPAPGGMRRLLKAQYTGSVRVLFGDVGAAQAAPPNDQPLKGYDAIGATELTTSSSAVDQYEQSARAIAAAVRSDPATRASVLPCEPLDENDSACFSQIVADLGRVAWRRPLVQAEIDRIVAAAQTSALSFGYTDAGLEAVISALLQSLYFLYVIEIGEPDPVDPTMRRLTPAELVTRMSFFLLNQTPDAALLDAADAGQLADTDGIKAVARQLLARPEARSALDAFYSEVLRVRELAIMEKDGMLFPQFTDALRASMRDETLRFAREIVWANRDARELFTASFTYVDSELAAIYGIPPPPGPGFTQVTLPAAQGRSGIFGHSGLLALLSHINSTSPTRRGLYVQTTLLCNPIPPPPDGVTPVLPPDDGMPKSIKDKLIQHMQDPSCFNCHGYMDPIGFALEHFDAIGMWRDTENGFPVDPTGTDPDLGDFNGAVELAQRVQADPRSTSCMIRHFLRHSMGHIEIPGETKPIALLEQSFAGSGYNIQDMLVELTASDAFRLVGDPK